LWSGFRQWRRREVAERERLEVLLLFDSYEHLLEIVWRDMSFATATTAVD
jgi:hypothetical protein